MTSKKDRIKLFQITVTGQNSLIHTVYKIPRELINLKGLLLTTFANPDIKIPGQFNGQKIGCLTLHINSKKINLLERYPVFGYLPLKRRLKPLSVKQDLEASSSVNTVYEDFGIVASTDYPYIVTVYLYGTSEKEIK